MTIFKLELISNFNAIYLKTLITFFRILDFIGSLLLGMEINPSSLYMPMLFKFMDFPSVSKMYIPNRSTI